MITMHELVDLRMQQHIAHEIYRQQIMQRIPDPFSQLLSIPSMQSQLLIPAHPSLPDCEANLENNDLWKQFHKIGTEMIITKTGRRMFPSLRLSLSGLEEDSNYCVLLEMVPIGDCRYKFSGSQWVPAGGAEPQSPQRMYLHPDSPASGAHWQSQTILFNKVKLTNNTLDNNGHIVLASMHKYQPHIHVIHTSDLTEIPWAPQQAFVFPETEFVAVTAYQNDRITKLKIDNNPFAKGFRETGQSRCKRKICASPTPRDDYNQRQQDQHVPVQLQVQQTGSDDDRVSVSSYESQPMIKRMRVESFTSTAGIPPTAVPSQCMNSDDSLRPSLNDFAAHSYYAQPQRPPMFRSMPAHMLHTHIDYVRHDPFAADSFQRSEQSSILDESDSQSSTLTKDADECADEFVDVVSTSTDQQIDRLTLSVRDPMLSPSLSQSASAAATATTIPSPGKQKSFSISFILGGAAN